MITYFVNIHTHHNLTDTLMSTENTHIKVYTSIILIPFENKLRYILWNYYLKKKMLLC